MGQISIVLIAGLIFLFSMDPSQYEASTGNGWALLITVGMVFLPASLAYVCGLLITRNTLPAKRLHRVFLFRHLLFAFELLVLVLFALGVYQFHLLAFVNQWFDAWPFPYTRQVLGIIPLVAGLLATYLAYYEIEVRTQLRRWSRWSYLQLRSRLLLLPLLPLLAYLAVLDLLQILPLSVRLVFIRYPYLGLVGLLLLLVFAYIRAVDFLRLIWPTASMPPCELRTRLDQLVARTNIRVRDVLIWQTQGTPIANAAVTGLLPRYRYILITDQLLDSLTPTEIEGVVAHELGHLKHKHLLNYLIYSLSYFFVYAAFHRLVGDVYVDWPHFEVWNSLFTIVFFGLYFVFLFRLLSRRFEHQADLYAVQLTKDPSAFVNALRKLSHTNRTPHAVQRWLEIFHTHPSIEQRQAFISRALEEDRNALRYLRTLPDTYVIRFLFPLLLLLCSQSVHTLLASPADVHREAGRQYALVGRYTEATQELEQAKTLDPENPDILYELAVLYFDQHEWDKVVNLTKQILRVQPDYRAASELLDKVIPPTGNGHVAKEETP